MNGIKQISRREFLRRTGYTTGGLVFAVSLTGGCQRPAGDVEPAVEAEAFAPNVYVNIRTDGVVEIVCHRSEMGQGIRTSLPQVIADELEADWDRIEIHQGTGDAKYGNQNTDGSTSIRLQFDLLRTAGATAREMLVAAAALAWDVPASECKAMNHAVTHAASGRSAGFGELVAAAARLEPPAEVTFKSPADYRYIGKSMDLIDGFAMTTGTAAYGIDTVLPGMLHASIARCPVVGGRVRTLDDTAARAVAGVIDVVRLPEPTSPPVFNPLGGVAVLATNTWAAQQGRAALAIEWDSGENAAYDSDTYKAELLATARKPGRVALNRGDVDAAFATAAKVHEAEYFAPHLSQAPMEPPAAAARINPDGSCEVWACTQDPQTAQGVVAGALGIEPADVTVNVTLLGGAFGRKSKPDFIAEAALLARAAGAPVKVTWTREDDIRHGYFHSVSAQRLRAGLDGDGNTLAWQQCTVFPSIFSTFDASVGNPSDVEMGLGCVDNPYAIPNLRIEAGDARAHVRIGWLRSVSNIYHAFASSCFVDELAEIAGMDPKEHLVRLLGEPRRVDPVADGAKYDNYDQSLGEYPIDTGRIAAVLDKAAEFSGWGRELPAGSGLGIAVHRSFLSTVGTVAEVTVDESGAIRVNEIWMVIDAGRVINPDRVTAQMEGAAIFGISLALHGEITAKSGAVVQGNFDDYPILRIGETPRKINVHIMDVEAPPGGVGEPGVPPVAPAIANAVFAATGKRLRQLPLRYPATA